LYSESAVYKRTVFPNGLKVITEAIPYVRSISLGLWVNVGSRDESLESSGISHFIEHMVFKGTANRTPSEIASYLESVGGILNAFTSREQTCFYAKILDQHLEKGVELLFDLAQNPLFDPSDIEKEKGVIIEEIKDIDDSPGDLVHDKFARTMFGNHSLGRPILGTKTTIQGISRRKIVRHTQRYYRPGNMLIAASGNLDHVKLVDLVALHLDQKSPEIVPDGRRKPIFKRERKVYKRETSQTHVCLGVPAKEFNDPSRAAATLLNSLLGGGMSSRLFQELRENLGLVYNVFSYLDFFQDTSIMGIYLGTNGRNVKRAIKAVLKQIERVSNEPLADYDLDKTKEQLKGNLMLGLENTSNRMSRLAKHELLVGRYISLDETISSIDSVKADEVVEIARELFQKTKYSAVVLGPVADGVLSVFD